MPAEHATSRPRRLVRGPERSAGRIVVLDGLRILAATMVVIYHYAAAQYAQFSDKGTVRASVWWGKSTKKAFPHLVHQVASYGWTGVDLFFLISGFVILMSGWGRTPADFFVSRVVRLVPAYWAAIVISTIVLIALPKVSTGISLRQVLGNLTMVQDVTGQKNIEPSFWTLLVELKFYLLFGLLAAAHGVTYKRMVSFCVLWTVASLAAVSSQSALLIVITEPKDSPYFIAGMAFYLIYRFGGNAILWGIVTFSWLLAMQSHPGQPLTDVALTVFFVLMGLIATHKADGIRWRWLTVAGAMTYPLYLVHQDLGFTAFAYLHGSASPLVLAACTYVAMLVLAWLIYRLIERPIAGPLKERLMASVQAIRELGPGAGAPTTAATATRMELAVQRVPTRQAAPTVQDPASGAPSADGDAMSRSSPGLLQESWGSNRPPHK